MLVDVKTGEKYLNVKERKKIVDTLLDEIIPDWTDDQCDRFMSEFDRRIAESRKKVKVKRNKND